MSNVVLTREKLHELLLKSTDVYQRLQRLHQSSALDLQGTREVGAMLDDLVDVVVELDHALEDEGNTNAEVIVGGAAAVERKPRGV
jgi:hypothetical protein